MAESDWEIRSQDTSFKTHIVAGSMAGLTEHLSMLPLDNIKTHCQTTDKPKIVDITKKIYNRGGLKNFLSGSSILVMSCIPAHGLYFLMYETAMEGFGLSNRPQGEHHPYLYGAVGAIAAVFHDLIMTPAQAIKQRLQLLKAEYAKVSSRKVIADMYRQEGINSFYRAFMINYFTSVPFSALLVALNEQLKNSFIGQNQTTTIKYFLCSGLAGLIATIPTTPFDVIKTKMNTQDCVNMQATSYQSRVVCQEACKEHIKDPFKGLKGQNRKIISNPISTSKAQQKLCGTSYCAKYPTIRITIARIYQEYGMRGFFKGLKMRLLIQTPSSSLSWGTYEFFKKYLSRKQYFH